MFLLYSFVVRPSSLLVSWREIVKYFTALRLLSLVCLSYHWRNYPPNCVISIYSCVKNLHRVLSDPPILCTMTFLNFALKPRHVLSFAPYPPAQISIGTRLFLTKLEFLSIGSGSWLTFYTISRNFALSCSDFFYFLHFDDLTNASIFDWITDIRLTKSIQKLNYIFVITAETLAEVALNTVPDVVTWGEHIVPASFIKTRLNKLTDTNGAWKYRVIGRLI